ncbi:MAG: ATP-binding cassette domain-containing protein [Thiolinea sp.]
MLEIDKLVVQRGSQVLHYDFVVHPGTLLTIQGRSGVGKSTLLDTVAGFLIPLSGDIRWQGVSLVGQAVEQRPVSMLFQAHNLFEHLSIMDNLNLGLSHLKHQSRDEGILSAAKALQVGDLLTRQPGQLSGGQRQRIALLRTLLRPEPIVLLDEPFTGLDNESRVLAADWVRSQVDNVGKTVLLVTHQDDDVMRIADRNVELGVSPD